MPRLNIQKLREQYSTLPTLKHHPSVLHHGCYPPIEYIKRNKRLYPSYDKKVENKL